MNVECMSVVASLDPINELLPMIVVIIVVVVVFVAGAPYLVFMMHTYEHTIVYMSQIMKFGLSMPPTILIFKVNDRNI